MVKMGGPRDPGPKDLPPTLIGLNKSSTSHACMHKENGLQNVFFVCKFAEISVFQIHIISWTHCIALLVAHKVNCQRTKLPFTNLAAYLNFVIIYIN